eukprot:850409_1
MDGLSSTSPSRLVSTRLCTKKETLALRKLTAGGNHDRSLGGSALRSDLLHGLHHVHALGDGAEHDVLSVQPCRLGRAEEELGSVGVGSGVGHGEDSGSGVLEDEVLVGELVAVDGLSSGSVVVGEIASLAHEAGNDAVER